ncbi:head-tail adaptor protein [Palleronia sp. KMU-117]|uniref:head-tail adaptor protein n=1 Tax=Palleronia sp. KMU-117 TaxID=3434108 RepID=UPI003D71F17F
MIRPRLNRPLALEVAERLPDGAGGFVDSWSALGTLWAEIRPGAGDERAQDFATLSRVSCRILVRAAPVGAPSRPRPEQRFRDGGRVWRILAVTESDATGAYLTCFAREEVAA